jgi:hypothetical protein
VQIVQLQALLWYVLVVAVVQVGTQLEEQEEDIPLIQVVQVVFRLQRLMLQLVVVEELLLEVVVVVLRVQLIQVLVVVEVTEMVDLLVVQAVAE